MKDVVVCVSIPKPRKETVPCTKKVIFQVLNKSGKKQLARVTVLSVNKDDLFDKVDEELEKVFRDQHIYVNDAKNGERFSHKDEGIIDARKVDVRFFDKLIAHVKRKFAEIGDFVPA
jgi:hypothetical protein